jgi:hypothetical protein
MSWQDRLILERDELADKLNKLKLFLYDDEKVANLSRLDVKLLDAQSYAMAHYLEILDRRLIIARR